MTLIDLINMKIIFICKLVTARQLGAFWARLLGAYFNKAAILQYGDKRAIFKLLLTLLKHFPL